MFYPNAYINFNQNGEYTKHYYNGTERIASRLGDAIMNISANNNDRLGYRIMQADEQARADLLELVEAEDVPIETPSVDVTSIQPTGSPSDIFYLHCFLLWETCARRQPFSRRAGRRCSVWTSSRPSCSWCSVCRFPSVCS